MNDVSAPGINRPRGKIDIPSAWIGAEMKANPDRWLVMLKASEIADSRGYDGGKKITGRKRHIIVDKLGLLLVVLVTVASAEMVMVMRKRSSSVRRCARLWLST